MDLNHNSDRVEWIQKQYKIDKMFVEKKSERDKCGLELKRLLGEISKQDRVYIESFSAIARNLTELLKFIVLLNEKGAYLVSIEEQLDTSTCEGQMRMAAFIELANFERSIIRQRQRQGIELALAEKRPYGRPKAKITDELRKAYLSWKKGRITAVEAMCQANVKRNTFYKLAKQLDEEFKGMSLFTNEI
ncbi:recombinase family protein [bacterium BFN5]|nr:recombinase family protein [bacterium BFN5]